MNYAFDLELVAAAESMSSAETTDLAGRRARAQDMAAQLPAPDLTGVTVADHRIPGPPEDPQVLVRVYRPHRSQASAGIYNVHAGGFTVGDVDMDDALCIEIARELGVVVVSVGYRLAPETRYPGPLEDVYAGLVWFAAQAPEFGTDPNRIAVLGTSAGGGLCAGLALLARDRGGPAIAFQYLATPELDDRLRTPSMAAFTDTPLFNRPAAVASWEAYLGPGVPGSNDVAVYAAPGRATNLSGWPSAYVSVMHFDPLRDEGITYAQALLAHGVTVELHLFPGTFHGSALVSTARVTRRDRAEKIAVLRQALRVPDPVTGTASP